MPNRSGATDPAGNQGSPGRNERQQASSAESARLKQPPRRHVDDHSSPNSQLDRETREMQYYNSLLEKLLNVISHGEEESVTHVISTIRSGASHDQILETIDQLTENASRTNGAGSGAGNGA